MKVETYQVFNPNALVETDLGESIRKAFVLNNRIITYVAEIRPDMTEKYISALKKRLIQAVQKFDINHAPLGLDEMNRDLKYLKQHPDLQILTVRFVAKQLDLPTNFQPGPEGFQVSSLNNTKSIERLSYHRTKACADVLGIEQGIQMWKAIINRLLKDDRLKAAKVRKERLKKGWKELTVPTLKELSEQATKIWTENGTADFTLAFLDENITLHRFDRCLTPEALKDYEDPDFAYLCSCYIGDAHGFNIGKTIHLRRTQTLHHADFCDELRWDSRIHIKPPEQPSLEFTKDLGIKDVQEDYLLENRKTR